MKAKYRIGFLLTIAQLPSLANAQGTFQDLNFESATLSPVSINQYPPAQVSVASALPGWSAYIGTDQQSLVYQNTYGLGLAEIDIFGPNYPAAGSSPGNNPGTIDGNYSVLLQSGGEPENNAIPTSVSIAQTGTVPSTAQTLEFEAWQSALNNFTVSFDGNALSPVVIGNGANYTLYGVNLSSYAGQSGPLEFTADFTGTGESWLGLDDISFSTVSVAPEPSPLHLTAIGGLVFALRRRFHKQRPQESLSSLQ